MNLMPWEKRYNSVEECDAAMEQILCALTAFKIYGKAVMFPGVNEILNIYEQAKSLTPNAAVQVRPSEARTSPGTAGYVAPETKP